MYTSAAVIVARVVHRLTPHQMRHQVDVLVLGLKRLLVSSPDQCQNATIPSVLSVLI